MTPDEIRVLEEAFYTAWPAAGTETLHDWRLRFTHGISRRANSVFALDWSGQDIDKDITAVEQIYRSQGLAPAFYLPPNGQPEGLDDLLVARGYSAEGHVHVQTLELSDQRNPSPSNFNFSITDQPTPDWITCFMQDSLNPDDRRGRANIMARVSADRAFLLATCGSDLIGCGMGMRVDGWLLIQGMRTTERHRGRGVGSGILAQLLNWGTEQGAQMAALQVETDNPAALRLYEKAGFTTAYNYHYRIHK